MSNPVRDESPHEPLSAAERRAEALRRAAGNKRQAAATRAEAANRQLLKNQEEIHFRSVARTGVSLDFLYTNPDLRRRIESLRAQQPRTPAPADQRVANDADGNIVHVLTGKLREERAARQAAVTELQERLAASHGEILRLRRVLQQHGIEH